MGDATARGDWNAFMAGVVQCPKSHRWRVTGLLESPSRIFHPLEEADRDIR